MINEYITSYHLPQLAETIKRYVDNKTSEPNIVKVTYDELVNLRNNGDLKEGYYYFITDYVTTTGIANTESAGYNFPIIVLATSSNTLSEEAVTTNFGAHSHFENSNLDAWKIWYCLDNNDDRFSWAGQRLRKTCFAFQLSITEWFSFERDKSLERIIDNTTYYGYKWEGGYAQTDTFNYNTILWYNVEYPELTITYERVDTPVYIENNGNLSEMTLNGYFEEFDSGKIGKGVIYRMIDEFGNDCPYDFKNIIYTLSTPIIKGLYQGYPQCIYTRKPNLDKITDDNVKYFAWDCYCPQYSDEVITGWTTTETLTVSGTEFYNADLTPSGAFDVTEVITQAYTFGENCHHNIIKPNTGTFPSSSKSIQYINTIILGDGCHNNSFDMDCHDISLYYNCAFNNFSLDCELITLGSDCVHNTFASNCRSMSLSHNCHDNTFGTNSHDESFEYGYHDNENVVYNFRNLLLGGLMYGYGSGDSIGAFEATSDEAPDTNIENGDSN